MNSGDLYNVEIPLSDGHEQAGTRPAIIVQASQFAEQLPIILIVNSSEPRIMAIQVTEDAIVADLVDGPGSASRWPGPGGSNRPLAGSAATGRSSAPAILCTGQR